MEADHAMLSGALPDDFYMTGFRELSSPWCDGRVLPTSCSGLAIASRHKGRERTDERGGPNASQEDESRCVFAVW